MAIGERFERGLEALKDIQWEIRENEARYRDLLDNQADLILRRDTDGCLTFVNQAFCRVFGVDRSAGRPSVRTPVLVRRKASPAGTRRSSAPAALRTGDRDRSWPALVRVGRAHGASHEMPSRGAMPRPRHHRAAPSRGRADGGAQAGGGRQPRQVAIPGSHEPRDPHADERHPRHDDADGRNRVSPEQHTYAHAIERQARTLLTLIDDILDFSKIEGDKLQLNSAPLAIDECVQGVVELLAPKAYEKDIDIAWAVDPALPRPLLGDEVRLRQIVTNLVGNAIKFTDSGGVLVTVGALAREQAAGGRRRHGHRHRGRGHRHRHRPGRAAGAVLGIRAGRCRRASPTGRNGLGLAISRRLARAMVGESWSRACRARARPSRLACG